MCGRHDEENNRLWTIDSLSQVAVAYLCLEHAAPLMEIVLAAGGKTLEQQIPVPFREPEPAPTAPPRGRGDMRLVPLLNWTPPEEVPIPLPPEPEPEDDGPELDPLEALVGDWRGQGRSWEEIAVLLGTTAHELQEKYSEPQAKAQ